MIDAIRGNAREVGAEELHRSLGGILADDEYIDKGFKMVRDLIVFTNKRLILVDKQGVTGKKVEIQSIPYRSVTRFAIETVGTFDMDSEMKIWLSGHSQPIERKLQARADIAGVQRIFATYVLA
ncbi:MAG: PH domain-containing protein [Anaerolineae bacterium]|nr:PH domain-containing protein [Anaerolineae bacterium]